MNVKTRKRISLALVLVLSLSLIMGSFAFFTDRYDTSATATAGNIDLVFTDVSSKDANITAGQQNSDDLIWTDGKITNDVQPIMNPGDKFDLGYKLSNTGSKSIDVRQQIILESDVALSDYLDADAQIPTEYTLNGTVLTLDKTNSTDKKLIYTYADIVLNGTKEADGAAAEQDFDIYLAFAREAKNIFMGSNVTITLDIQAKQHRNTTTADWIDWASYKTNVEQITA